MEVNKADADKENCNYLLHIPELNMNNSKHRKLPPPATWKKNNTTQDRSKKKLKILQPHAIVQQQHIPLPNNNEEIITQSIVAIAPLPPFKMMSKITSLQNKLDGESEKRIIMEVKQRTGM